MHNQTGSGLTKIAREHTLNHLRQTLRDIGMAAPMQTLAAKHIERYVQHQQTAGVDLRTLQNRLSHIRSELRAMGRDKLADSERLSCKSLGISGACRDGTHRALTRDAYTQALAQAKTMDAGFAACLALQYELGLRAREAISCMASLKTWEKSLLRGDRIHILHGTKGGRVRDTLPNDRAKALEAVREALTASRGGQAPLIASKTLQGAARAYGRYCHALGLKAESASHALRCAYAQERFTRYLEIMDRTEALAAVSLDLGHGDGRGRYVSQVYLR